MVIEIPKLDHDAMMLKRFGQTVSAAGRTERRIVANLIAHMESHGWMVQSVYDGDDDTQVKDMKSAMELIFNLDECRLYFQRAEASHQILLVLGNGTDIISDWSYAEGDADGFNKAVDSFDVEAVL